MSEGEIDTTSGRRQRCDVTIMGSRSYVIDVGGIDRRATRGRRRRCDVTYTQRNTYTHIHTHTTHTHTETPTYMTQWQVGQSGKHTEKPPPTWPDDRSAGQGDTQRNPHLHDPMTGRPVRETHRETPAYMTRWQVGQSGKHKKPPPTWPDDRLASQGDTQRNPHLHDLMTGRPVRERHL